MKQNLTDRMIFRYKDGAYVGSAWRSITRLGSINATIKQTAAEVTLQLDCIPFSALNLPPQPVKDVEEANEMINEYIAECIEVRDMIPVAIQDQATRAHNKIINGAIQSILSEIRSQTEKRPPIDFSKRPSVAEVWAREKE